MSLSGFGEELQASLNPKTMVLVEITFVRGFLSKPITNKVVFYAKHYIISLYSDTGIHVC